MKNTSVYLLIVAFFLNVTAAFGAPKDVTPGIYTPGHFTTANFVKNPSCASNLENITNASSILTRTTSTPLVASLGASCAVDGTATSQYVKWTTRTFDVALDGQNCEAQLIYKGDASLYKMYVEKPAGTKVSQDLQLLDSGSYSKTASVIFPCGVSTDAATVILEPTSSSAAAIKVTDVYAGKATNLSNASIATDWVAYTPTFTGFGTVTSVNVYSRRVGDTLEVQGSFVTGTVSASNAAFTLGYNGVNGTLIVATRGLGTTSVVGHAVRSVNSVFGDTLLATPASSILSFSYQGTGTAGLTPQAGNAIFGNGQTISFRAVVPIEGWTSTGVAVRADQTNYPWTAYTPTFTGFGTVTSIDCQHKRDAEDLLLRCKFTMGTNTATEARVSLPGSLTSADTSKMATIQLAGDAAISTSSGAKTNVLIEPSTAYVTFGLVTSGAVPLSKINGSTFSNSTTMSFHARFPITGWLENQKAPVLVGSVTSGTTASERIERATLTNTNGGQAVSAQSGTWIGTSSCSGTGICTYAIVSGMFSATPACSCATSTSGISCVSSATSSTSVTVRTRNGSGDFNDSGVGLICMGPR